VSSAHLGIQVVALRAAKVRKARAMCSCLHDLFCEDSSLFAFVYMYTSCELDIAPETGRIFLCPCRFLATTWCRDRVPCLYFYDGLLIDHVGQMPTCGQWLVHAFNPVGMCLTCLWSTVITVEQATVLVSL